MVSLRSIRTVSERSWDNIIFKLFNNFLEAVGIDPSVAHVVKTKAIKQRIQDILDTYGFEIAVEQVPYKKYQKSKKDSDFFVFLQET